MQPSHSAATTYFNNAAPCSIHDNNDVGTNFIEAMHASTRDSYDTSQTRLPMCCACVVLMHCFVPHTYQQGEGMRKLRLLLIALLFAPAALVAQETGKIQGRVTDAASGAPIAGAQVVIVGTRLGNITNSDGFYFVNNVPAGLQDIQSHYLGYQSVTVRQTRVLAGQTLTQNFQMAQGAVEVAPLEVIGESRPLVPRDQVGSKN